MPDDNIIISEGLDAPWELKGTDYEKQQNEIVLFNLAVGQFAKLGSDFGKTLNVQASVTKELAAAVNMVLDRSAEISTALTDWLPSSYSFSLPNDAINFQFAAGKINLSDTTSTISKLIAASQTIQQYKLTDVDSINNVDYKLLPYYYSFGPLADGSKVSGVSPDIKKEPANLTSATEFQLYVSSTDSTKINVFYQGELHPVDDYKKIWIPKSSSELSNMETQVRYGKAGYFTDLLSDSTKILPVPSEESASGGVVDGSNVLDLSVPVGETDAIRFLLSTNPPGYIYSTVPPDKIPTVSNDLTDYIKYPSQIVKTSDGSYKYVQKISDNLYSLINVTAERYVQAPTAAQKSAWISGYSTKTVRITQRSAEQSNFVSALTQRYNYFFEAASYALKAFTNLFSQLINNL